MTNFIPRWSVVFADLGITESKFRRWINAAGVPTCWSFFMDPYGQIRNDITSYGSFPFSVATNSITLFSADNTGVSAMGICYPNQHICSIGVWSTDTDIDIGARIWHEFLHAQNLLADDMKTTQKEDFYKYLVSKNSPYADFYNDPNKYDDMNTPGHSEILCAFYMFLTEKHFDCECYGRGCSTVDPADNPWYPPVDPTDNPLVENPIITFVRENPLAIGIAGVVGLILLI